MGLALDIFATMWERYSLSDLILLDNYRVCHLVNLIDLLILRSFVKLTSNNTIISSISYFLIVGWGKRLMNKLLNSPTGETIEDLEFYNVIVVEDFYTNIVS